jgi:site-specific DNA recombinase
MMPTRISGGRKRRKSSAKVAPTMRAVLYFRVSTDDQSAGLDAQRDKCVDWCKSNGYAIVGDPHVDEDVSGATALESCVGLMLAIQTLEPGDILLVAKRDRLARSRLKAILADQEVEQLGCRVVSASGEGTESDSAEDRLLRGIIDLFAEFERDKISARTIAALAAKQARNLRTGRVPYGRTVVDDGQRSKSKTRKDGTVRGGKPIALAEDAHEQFVLGFLLSLRGQGATYYSIRDTLNHKGLTTKSGKPWQASSVRFLCLKHHQQLKVISHVLDHATPGPSPDPAHLDL